MLLNINFFIGIVTRSKKTVFRLARLVPSIRKKLDDELERVAEGFTKDVQERTKGLTYITQLPEKGLNNEEIFEFLKQNLDLGML